MKFSHKLTLTVGGLLLISLSTLSYFQYKTSQANLRDQVYIDTDHITAKIAENIDTKMMSYKSVFNFMMKSYSGDYSKDNVRKTLNNPALKDDFSLVAMGYTNGDIVSDNKAWEEKAIAKQYDPRVRPWYKDAQKDKEIGFTKPYLGSISKKLLISLYAPALDNSNNFKGAFFADIPLTFLSDLIDTIEITNGAGKVFIVNSAGTIVAHPNKDLIMKPMTDFVPDLSIKLKEVQRSKVDGRDMLFGFAPLNKMPWYVVGMVDEKNAFQVIADMGIKAMTFVVIALIICTALVLVLIPILFRPLTRLNSAIEGVASGDADLTQRLDTLNTDKEFAVISDNFNRFIERLQHQIDETKQSSKRIRELSETSKNIGEGARQTVNTQQAELDQLVTAMNEMSSTAQEVAANAQDASSATEDARHATEKGSQIVNKSATISQNIAQKIEQAGELVLELEQSTNDIESILEVITQISEQTNLLALNAAIEAARAGDSGRGFAVVADEVRTLAQRTQDSTTEISAKIEHLQQASKSVVNIMQDSTKEVEVSVTVAKEANDELATVSHAITNATDLVTQIASAAEEQHGVAEEININTNNIKDLTTDVIQAIENSAQQSNEQDQLVNFQEELLGHFKV